METGYRLLCSRCFNEKIAARGRLDFQHVQFEPLTMRDGAGAAHGFHFRVHLLGDRVAINAFELKDGEPRGFEFQLLDAAETDLFALMARLIGRMRCGLALRHLTIETGRLHIADRVARGRIERDAYEDDSVPLLVIDGREIPWAEFGRMLMSFEGWQITLEIHDRSAEI